MQIDKLSSKFKEFHGSQKMSFLKGRECFKYFHMMITVKKYIYNFTNLENYLEICLIIVVYLRREIHNLHCFVRFYFPFAFLFSECWYEFGKYDFNDENRSGIRRFYEIDKNTIQYISRKRWVVYEIVRIDYCCIRYLRHILWKCAVLDHMTSI